MKKQYKSSITKNHKIEIDIFYCVPLKGYVGLTLFLDFAQKKKKKKCRKIT